MTTEPKRTTEPHTAIDFQQVFEGLSEHYVVLAPDAPKFTILAASDSYVELTDTDRAAVIGRSLHDVFPTNPDPEAGRQADLIQALETVIESKQTEVFPAFRYDLEDPKDPGTFVERHWSPIFEPILDDLGEVAFILHRADDVTEFVIRERHSRHSEGDSHVLKRVLALEPDPRNRTFLRRFFATEWDVVVTDTAQEVIEEAKREPPNVVYICGTENREEVFDLLVQLDRLRSVRDFAIVVRFAETDEALFARAYNNGANDVLGPTSTARELLARLQTQLALADLSSTLRERSREQYYQLFEQAPFAIAIMEGPEMVISLANPAHLELVGRRPLIGRPARTVFPEPEYAAFLDRIEAVYQTGEPFSAVEAPFPNASTESGSSDPRYITFSYLPFRGLDEEIAGVASFAFDVTEQVRAREELLEAKQFEMENRRKDEFLAMLGHELRNPLSPIATAADVLQMSADSPDPEQVRWAGELVERQVNQLTRLVDDLLDVSRINRGLITTEPELCSLGSFIDDAVTAVRHMLDNRSQRLHVDLPDAPVRTHVDPRRMTQVVSNLLENASKYSPPESDIWLEAESEREWLTIAVEDEGRGISAELLPHIFDLFTQADNSLDRAEGGLGLGLTLVQRIVDLHGGDVAVESEGEGKGSRFTVHLPVVVDESNEASSAEDNDMSQKVLLIEDNPDVADALRRLMEIEGLAVRIAATGAEGLDELQTFRPDLVFLDIGLPGMDGYEVVRQIRRQPGGQETYVIALTGYGQEADRERALAAGFDQHIVKPIDKATLDEVFESLD